MAFLDNVRVGTKVGLNSGLILLLLLFVSGAAVLGLSGADSSFRDYRSLARQSNAEADIAGELLAARIAVKDFMQTGRDSTIEDVRRRVGRADAAITEAQAIVSDAATKAKLGQVDADIAQY